MYVHPRYLVFFCYVLCFTSEFKHLHAMTLRRFSSFAAILKFPTQKLCLHHPLKRVGSAPVTSFSLSSTPLGKEFSSASTKEPTSHKGFGLDPAIANTEKLKGLRAESNRLYLRAFKKVSKCSERLEKANAEFQRIMSLPEPSMEELEKCPNIDEIKTELQGLQANLSALASLEQGLKDLKSGADPKFIELEALAASLSVGTEPPPKPERGEKKTKGSKVQEPRKPYYTYKSSDNIDIRVGRSSSDNDELSCNEKYRDAGDWWLHASGCPGSHVVIRYTGDDLQEKYPETVKDAVCLAALYSKAEGSKASVTLTRCRYVTKPKGVPAGQVRLNGDIILKSINLKAEAKRFARLDSTTDRPKPNNDQNILKKKGL